MGKRSRESKASASQEPAKSDDQAPAVMFTKNTALDPSLALLFASSAGPVKAPPKARYSEGQPQSKKPRRIETSDESDGDGSDSENENENEDLSSFDGDIEDMNLLEDVAEVGEAEPPSGLEAIVNTFEGTGNQQTRKRKRHTNEDDLEGKYMLRIAKEEAKEEQERKAERNSKRQMLLSEQVADLSQEKEDFDSADPAEYVEETTSETRLAVKSLPLDVPRHETLDALDKGDSEIEKATRTVFLANVSTSAITDKRSKRVLLEHLSSFLDSLPSVPDGTAQHKVESIRFRSTAYTGRGLPKKAAFATKSLMDTTTKSTNAYVVYSNAFAAREAVKRLNATIVLDRHLRVDGVAHPAKTDHRRCVFVGNLGFVDDESMMEEGGENERKRSKIPSDVEEGLWRQFGKAGKVESVRVIRDEKTRVGKGFAYVQFQDINAVEAALLFHEKKFPPMLPRKLRVTRAKAVKKTDRAETKSGRPSSKSTSISNKPSRERIYNPKVSSQQQSLQGRAGRLLGKAGAANLRKFETGQNGLKADVGSGEGRTIRAPESFVFEGYRASAGNRKPKDLKLGGKGFKKSKGKPNTRSSKRGTEWKSKGGRKSS